MMLRTDELYSRTIAAAAALGSAATDRHRFIDKSVLLTGEIEVLLSRNGKEIARDALMLLMKICRNVTVGLPPAAGNLAIELQTLAQRIAPEMPVQFIASPEQYENFDAILSVGSMTRSDLPWTVVNSNGWLMRVSSGNINLTTDVGEFNPVGALGSASLGVTEVFKRLIVLRPDCGELLDGLSFSLWDHCESVSPGPPLPAEIRLNILVAGAGAIGSGNVYLLSRLPISGAVTIVDKQAYGPENWGTCIAIGTDDIGKDKAKVLSGLLPGADVKPLRMDLADVGPLLGSDRRFPTVAINGLDNVVSRHLVQQLWPDLVIDGAIGTDFSCQASCHPWGEDIACLICLFREQPSSERVEVIQSKATGLSVQACLSADDVVTEQHVDDAPEERRVWLAAHVGQKICSVIAEAMAQSLSSEDQRPGFQPSVPFVACYSSCMVVAELVRSQLIGQTLLAPRRQLNLLWGPHRGDDFPQRRRHDCVCTARSSNINSVRRKRLA